MPAQNAAGPTHRNGEGAREVDLLGETIDSTSKTALAHAQDRLLAVSGDWSIATDGIQWILQRRRGSGGNWRPVSFVRTTRDVLARCMREKGAPPADAARLLAGLPLHFRAYTARTRAISESSP